MTKVKLYNGKYANKVFEVEENEITDTLVITESSTASIDVTNQQTQETSKVTIRDVVRLHTYELLRSADGKAAYGFVQMKNVNDVH